MEVATIAENLTKPAEAVSPLSSQPWLHQHGKAIQAFGTVRQFPLALAYETRMYACQRLNQIHAGTQILYSLYKKHHWLMRGASFFGRRGDRSR
jgi:starvation-inducible DNA-binding protein